MLLTSQKVDGKFFTFKAGDVIEEKYINTVHIERYLASGILKIADASAESTPANKTTPKPARFSKKPAVTGESEDGK